MDLHIQHRTAYNFSGMVELDRHRLMLRPRDSFDMRIVSTGLEITPQATLNWTHDVYGNSVCWADFPREPVHTLIIDSHLTIQRYQPAHARPSRAPWIMGAPVAYSHDEQAALAPFIQRATDDQGENLAGFAMSAVNSQTTQSDHPLRALADAIHGRLTYQMRFEEGTQAPAETLRLGAGSCRDYAWLFIESARCLGYGARFVTGYLHSVGFDDQLTAPSVGYSHAWAEIFVPGDGWIEFDPTNLLVSDRQLIRVAVTRTPQEATPVSGSFTGPLQSAAPDVSVVITPVAVST